MGRVGHGFCLVLDFYNKLPNEGLRGAIIGDPCLGSWFQGSFFGLPDLVTLWENCLVLVQRDSVYLCPRVSLDGYGFGSLLHA